jgi:hypothetical protein
MPPHIYLLPSYANPDNLQDNRGERSHESKISYAKTPGVIIHLSEKNSLVEDRYSLEISSTKIVASGTNESKEVMLHHHPIGHPDRHLQFRLYRRSEVIRISLEPLSADKCQDCLKGFLHISQDLLKLEEKEHNIPEDLTRFFFNKDIHALEPYRDFLLRRIQAAQQNGRISNDAGKPLSIEEINDLKKEKHLSPFFAWNSD